MFSVIYTRQSPDSGFRRLPSAICVCPCRLFGLRPSHPLHRQLPVVLGAVTKIQIYQILIRNPGFYCQGLEVCDRFPVKAYGDRLLQSSDIRILTPFHFGKIIVSSHRSSPIIPFLEFVRLSCGDDSNH